MESLPGVLLGHLPAIYHTSDDLREVLAIFEELLLGSSGKTQGSRSHPSGKHAALADQIATIASLFDPHETPKEFLQWLAKWVALTHFSGLPMDRQRRLLATIVPLYGMRGTRHYLENILQYYLPEGTVIEIDDLGSTGFQVGDTAVGIDTRLGGDTPFWFKVRILMSDNPAQWEEEGAKERKKRQIRRVIDLAKPAHTMYELEILTSEGSEL